MFLKGNSGLSSVVQLYLTRAAQHLGVPSVSVRGAINKKENKHPRKFIKCLTNGVCVKK